MPKKKSNAGRPTKYTPEMVDKVKEYLAMTKDEIKDIVKSENAQTGFVSYEERLVVSLPTIDDLAVYLGVNRDTIYEWVKIHKEFSDSVDLVVAEQKRRLLNNGLGNIYNASMAKFVLSANHGMSEKTTQTNINVEVDDDDVDGILKSNGLI